jgi:hypothetical protein
MMKAPIWDHRIGMFNMSDGITHVISPWSPALYTAGHTPPGSRAFAPLGCNGFKHPVPQNLWICNGFSHIFVICEIAGFRETHHWHAIFSGIPGCFTLLSLQLHCYIFLLGKLRVELAKLTTAFSTSCDADPVEGVFWHGDGSDGTPIYCHG